MDQFPLAEMTECLPRNPRTHSVFLSLKQLVNQYLHRSVKQSVLFHTSVQELLCSDKVTAVKPGKDFYNRVVRF